MTEQQNDQFDEIDEITAMLDEMDRRDQPQAEQPEESQPKKKIWGKVLYFGLLSLFVMVFVGCAIYIGDYVVNSKKTNDSYTDLASQIQALRDANASTTPTEGDGPQSTHSGGEDASGDNDTVQILPEYQELYAQYNTLVGWIQVPGTDVDYPVFQTPDSPDFYLRKDMDGNYSRWGCIYVREECDVFKPSDNVVIYGHHMRDGTMFYSLDNYKEYDFWVDHQFFTFDTIYEHHMYQVIAVFKTSANIGEGFSYHIFNDAANEAEFNAFISKVHELQFYNTGVTAEYGDMLVTLSTCEYTLDNGRFVVVAKRVS